jgi:hypothetical protein
MRKLRIVLAGILLTMPLFALNANSSGDEEGDGVEIQQASSLTGSCWVFYNGRWYIVPC